MNKQPFYHQMDVVFVALPEQVGQAISAGEYEEKLGRFLRRQLGPIVGGPLDITVHVAPAQNEEEPLRRYQMLVLFTGTDDYSEDANTPEFRTKLEGFLKRNVSAGLLKGSLAFQCPVDSEAGDPADLM